MCHRSMVPKWRTQWGARQLVCGMKNYKKITLTQTWTIRWALIQPCKATTKTPEIESRLWAQDFLPASFQIPLIILYIGFSDQTSRNYVNERSPLMGDTETTLLNEFRILYPKQIQHSNRTWNHLIHFYTSISIHSYTHQDFWQT